MTDNSIAHTAPNIRIVFNVNSYSVPDQAATELHANLVQLAPTVREPRLPGGGAEPIADIIISFIIEHAASGTIEALAGGAALKIVKKAIDKVLQRTSRPQEDSTAHPQRELTTSIVLQNSPVSIENVNSIGTTALPPDVLARVPNLLADLPSHLSHPPLAEHTIENLKVPIGYLGPLSDSGQDKQYKDPNDPLR